MLRIDVVKTISVFLQAGCKWSWTNRCWYIPLSKGNYEKPVKALKDKAVLKTDVLESHLSKEKKDNLLITYPNTADRNKFETVFATKNAGTQQTKPG